MRHATREGSKSSFWTYLKVNGCRGCQKEEETIHHVLGRRCEAIGKNRNNKYRVEIRRTLEKCRKLMNDKHNSEGVIQADNALPAMKRPRRQVTPKIKKEEELALRQMISGNIPEWQENGNKEKKETLTLMRLWTGEMMHWTRTQMKMWMEKKNAHKASVQRRWDNRQDMNRVFQRWKKIVRRENSEQNGGKENERSAKKE
eukprot:6179273-Pleurochrysis_carterae.AAC.1